MVLCDKPTKCMGHSFQRASFGVCCLYISHQFQENRSTTDGSIIVLHLKVPFSLLWNKSILFKVENCWHCTRGCGNLSFPAWLHISLLALFLFFEHSQNSDSLLKKNKYRKKEGWKGGRNALLFLLTPQSVILYTCRDVSSPSGSCWLYRWKRQGGPFGDQLFL